MLDSGFLLPCSFSLFIRLGSGCSIVHARLIFWHISWSGEFLVAFRSEIKEIVLVWFWFRFGFVSKGHAGAPFPKPFCRVKE